MGLFLRMQGWLSFSFNTENKKDVPFSTTLIQHFTDDASQDNKEKKGRKEKINTKHTDYKGKRKTVIIHTSYVHLWGKILRHLQNSYSH